MKTNENIFFFSLQNEISFRVSGKHPLIDIRKIHEKNTGVNLK